ncbi:MAG: methyltransferase domain-containing protein [Acidimicrobiia bacterium]|nr:methyltransferase domain-containing protein [Acidimicrobiia bacterium]
MAPPTESGSLETYYKDHWVDIEPERLARYDRMFQLDDRRGDIILAPVGVQEGETVVDFGCGPGFVAAQLARLTGPGGHVHAVDVNEAFVTRAREVADASGRGGQITVHHATDERVPLGDASADRVYAKNVLEYVPDAAAVLAELYRVLRPGGRMVASDSDFGFVVIEPLAPPEVHELFSAAAPAFKEPHIGRKLRAAYRRGGFENVEVRVTAATDTSGFMRGVIENMLGYGLQFDRISQARADELRHTIDVAIEAGEYLMVLPQWWVTGTKPAG